MSNKIEYLLQTKTRTGSPYHVNSGYVLESELEKAIEDLQLRPEVLEILVYKLVNTRSRVETWK